MVGGIARGEMTPGHATLANIKLWLGVVALAFNGYCN
jgi:hypothetical protein